MARDSSGNYALPAGNPVVTGTTIESVWANTTMSDIANALTNSLDRTGKGGMQAPLLLDDGTGIAPSLAYVQEPTTGFYRAASGDMRLSILGAEALRMTGKQLRLTDDGADALAGPVLDLYRNSATPADNDFIGELLFSGESAAGVKFEYAAIEGRINVAADGSERGQLRFEVGDGGFEGSVAMIIESTVAAAGPIVTLATTTEIDKAPFNILGDPAFGSGTNALNFKNDDTGSVVGGLTYDFANDAMSLRTGSAEHLLVDTSGNVGIGTTSPSDPLHVIGSGLFESSGSFADVSIVNTDNNVCRLLFGDSAANNQGQVRYDHSDDSMEFRTDNTQALRIDSAQRLLVGTSSAGDVTSGSANALRIDDNGIIRTSKSATGTETHFILYNPNGTVGSIQTNGTTTSFNTSSDERLKENIEPAVGGLELVNQIPVDSFDWKATGEHQDFGGIAQKWREVIPWAVSAGADPDEMMGIDYSKPVPALIKAVQELAARVEALEG